MVYRVEEGEELVRPASLKAPRTYGELVQMREDVGRYFSDARVAALSDREKGSAIGTLDSTIATESWKIGASIQDNDPLPPDIAKACESYLQLMGAASAPKLTNTIAGRAAAIMNWLKAQAGSVFSA